MCYTVISSRELFKCVSARCFHHFMYIYIAIMAHLKTGLDVAQAAAVCKNAMFEHHHTFFFFVNDFINQLHTKCNLACFKTNVRNFNHICCSQMPLKNNK